jgi:hypothetical protein
MAAAAGRQHLDTVHFDIAVREQSSSWEARLQMDMRFALLDKGAVGVTLAVVEEPLC